MTSKGRASSSDARTLPHGSSDEASREDQAAEDDAARLASRDAGQRLRLDQGASLVSAERPAAKVPWSEVCPACKLYPGQEHRYDETCKAERPAANSYWIGWGLGSHRARHVYPDGTVVTLCGKSGSLGNVSRGSEGAYPEKSEASCGTCRRLAINLGISLVQA